MTGNLLDHGRVPGALVAEDEVVAICQDLLRIDSQNYGDDTGPGERAAAEYVMASLEDVGLHAEYFESRPGRASVVLHLPGRDSSRGALVVHGHLDVVPAKADEWSVNPLGGEEHDGMLWGRGAVDMKDMDAMILALVRELARTGRRPARDLIIAFFADEETGGGWGAQWATTHRRELFDGAAEAVSEVGGFSVDVNGRRAYLLQTAEKSLGWLRVIAEGPAGHGSQAATENAVVTLANAVARIGAYRWPVELTDDVARLLRGICELAGLPFDQDDPDSVARAVDAIGPAKRFVGASIRTTVNPTRLQAGYKDNVIPSTAEATIDARFLPGHTDEALRVLAELAGPGTRIEPNFLDVSTQAPFEAPIVETMIAALQAEDPDAVVLPYMLSAGTDNKSLSRLGIRGYGFVPLRLPPDLDFTAMFHGVDERVPIASLQFGVGVLRRFLLEE